MDGFPSDPRHVKDLIYYDGPQVSVYLVGDQPYLAYYIDFRPKLTHHEAMHFGCPDLAGKAVEEWLWLSIPEDYDAQISSRRMIPISEWLKDAKSLKRVLTGPENQSFVWPLEYQDIPEDIVCEDLPF
jgi:hypothetical protein